MTPSSEHHQPRFNFRFELSSCYLVVVIKLLEHGNFYCKSILPPESEKLLNVQVLELVQACYFCFFWGTNHINTYEKKRESIRKEKLFRQNGGYLLQEKLSSYGNGEMTKHFTIGELQRATDNYNRSRFLGQGGYGTVYKGMLPYGTIVVVKKSKEIRAVD